MGWTQCYWCDYWVENPYILDWIGSPLCDLCYDWHLGEGRFASYADADWFGGPYEPCARTRNSSMLQSLFSRLLSLEILDIINCFLCDWHEP